MTNVVTVLLHRDDDEQISHGKDFPCRGHVQRASVLSVFHQLHGIPRSVSLTAVSK